MDKEILVDESILDPKLQIFKTQNILGPNLIFVDISMAILGNYKDNFDTGTNQWVSTPKQVNLVCTSIPTKVGTLLSTPLPLPHGVPLVDGHAGQVLQQGVQVRGDLIVGCVEDQALGYQELLNLSLHVLEYL